MAITSKRAFPIAFVDGGQTEIKLTRGMLMYGAVLSVFYSLNVTTAGTAVRALSMPIKRLLLIGDGKILHVAKAVDLINKVRIFDIAPLASVLVPPSGFTIATYNNLEAHVTLAFSQLFANNGDLTLLPSWAYDDLTLRVEWGSVGDCLVGAPVGTVTCPAGNSFVTQVEAAGVNVPDPTTLAKVLGISLDRYQEVNPTPVSAIESQIIIPLTQDIRALLITTEDATGEPTNGILSQLSFVENKTGRIISALQYKTLRADNARVYGISPFPTGVCVIDFAEDRDITKIYQATKQNSVDLLINTTAVAAGTLRVHSITIDKPKAA